MTIEYPRKVTITIEEQDNVFSNVFVTEDSDTWQSLVLKLLNTVNAVYGYNVKDSVLFVSNLNYADLWTEEGEMTISAAAAQVAKDKTVAEFNSVYEDDEE